MAKGITIEEGTPRSLCVDGEQVATGGAANRAGLYADGSNLLLDGEVIAEGEDNTGLLMRDGSLYFGGVEVGAGEEPPTPPAPQSGLWVPPMQEASTRNKYNARDYIRLYDALMDNSGYPGTITKYEYTESVDAQNPTIRLSNGDNYHDVPNWIGSFVQAQSGAYNSAGGAGFDNVPLYHYEFIPNGGYNKTYIVEGCIHGSEHSASQTLYRIMDIICNHCNEAAYSRLASMRDNVRFIVIPVVNPWGHDTTGGNGDMNIRYTDWDGHSTKIYYDRVISRNLNPNRNADFNHTFPEESGGGDRGNYPWQVAETRHIKNLVERIGVKNIDYLFDFHDDTGSVPKHFWFNYNMDGPAADATRECLEDLIDYEEELRIAGGEDRRRLFSVKIKVGSTELATTITDSVSSSRKTVTLYVSTQEIADLINNAARVDVTGNSYLLHKIILTHNGEETQLRGDANTYILQDHKVPEASSMASVSSAKYVWINPKDAVGDIAVGDTITLSVTPYLADEKGYIHPNVADQGGYSNGTVNAWLGVSLGVLASGPEYIGGIFGYNFDEEMMTRSLRVRANVMLYMYDRVNTKGWRINEPDDAKYYHFDYCMGMTRQGLRLDASSYYLEIDGVKYIQNYSSVTEKQVRDRWEELWNNNTDYITRQYLGATSTNGQVYGYVLGAGEGKKKVMFLGGSMRWVCDHKESEFSMFVLAQYLCDDYFVNQSKFLRRLKDNYTIVVLPMIDLFSTSEWTNAFKLKGLNHTGEYGKWTLSGDKCVPAGTYADVTIYKKWLDDNSSGALIILSGGEDTIIISSENPKYFTNMPSGGPQNRLDWLPPFDTQFIIPKRWGTENLPAWFSGYIDHLVNDREEPRERILTQTTAGITGGSGLTCGDYAYDNYGIPFFFINYFHSTMWEQRKQYAQAKDTEKSYMHRNYETGRRVADLVNFYLMAGGDIAPEGGLVEEGGEA